MRTKEEKQMASKRQKRRSFLQRLRDRLQILDYRQDLNHLITVEDCPDCQNAAHPRFDSLCYRDIQYYNVHPDLIEAFSEFRRDYFGNDDFLPEPFRLDKLEEAANELK
jgi:hypothetical protein